MDSFQIKHARRNQYFGYEMQNEFGKKGTVMPSIIHS